MNRKVVKIKLPAIGLLAALWAFPLIRLSHTLVAVLKVYSEDQSINSWNDVRWNYMVGIGYLLCILAGMAAILIPKPAGRINWLGYTPAILAAIFFCFMPFDGVIVHMTPPPIPIAAGLLCLICIGLSWFGISQTVAKKPIN